MQLATVFSGIGAPEQACRKIYGVNGFNIVFACDNGEIEIPQTYEQILELIKNKTNDDAQNFISKIYSLKKENLVKKSYLANYSIVNNQWFEDIRFLNGKKFKNQIDLLVGGSPCQSFSAMGHRGGLEDARGTLFYNYAKLIKDSKPRFFIYENVPGMLTIDGGQTWIKIKDIFDSLGYHFYPTILDSQNYGIPQKRNRLYVVGIRKDISKIPFIFPKPQPLETTAFDYLEKEVDPKYYLKKVGFKFVSTHPSRAKINQKIIRTEKANQQFNWNGNFIFEKYNEKRHDSAIKNGAYLGEYNGEKGLIRKLTPRECLNLMGFGDFNIVVSDHYAYRQAGNSMVVNVMEAIIRKLIKEYKL